MEMWILLGLTAVVFLIPALTFIVTLVLRPKKGARVSAQFWRTAFSIETKD